MFKMRVLLIGNGPLRKDKYAGTQPCDFFHKAETGSIQSIRTHHPIFTLFFELRKEELFLADHLRLVIHCKKVMQAARMVAMSMRQYQKVHITQVNPKCSGIPYKKVGGPGVEQQTMLTRINKQGKPMLSL